ncbi:MAG: MarR family transcriptional regulator [Flavobacteriaceae bacterium]|nr:MarR family transcriptional regulator [Flavobacteriaceae bacterium]
MEIKDSLFQDMSANYAEMFHFTPLTAHIFTYLLFDFEQNGLTFDQIQTKMCASKSSISNALNRLVQSNFVEYINKIGDRKRYYRINKEIFLIQFQEELTQLKKNKSILNRYANYRQKQVGLDIHSQNIELHLQLLDTKIKMHEQTMEQLQQLNKSIK